MNDRAAKNEKVLRQLVNALESSVGQFKLVVVRVEGRALRDRLVERVAEICRDDRGLDVVNLSVADYGLSLLDAIEDCREGRAAVPDMVQVVGLDELSERDLERFFTLANQARGQLRSQCAVPIALWMDDAAFDRMVARASDLESWATSKRFQATVEDAREELKFQLEWMLEALEEERDLDWMWAGEEPLVSASCWRQMAAAYEMVAEAGETTAEQDALVAFGRGRSALESGKFERAIGEFERAHEAITTASDRRLLMWIEFQLGVAMLRQADRHPWSPDCLDAVSDRFVAAQKAWEALGISQPEEEEIEIDGEIEHCQRVIGWERISSSSACQVVGHWECAIVSEREGRIKDAMFDFSAALSFEPFYVPHLFLAALSRLNNLEFCDGRYVAAFAGWQWHQQIERWAGLRAFVGAGRLQPQGSKASDVPPEIGQFGRGEDLKTLGDRIRENETRLVAIGGASGVGKSSLVSAGLVPQVARENFEGGRDGVAIVVRQYEDWRGTLRTAIERALTDRKLEPQPGADEASMLENLRSLAQQRHVQPVLVFDQFEEFFFANSDAGEQRQFFEFLGTLFAEPNHADKQLGMLTVVLSLREDYLHLLLPANRIEAIRSAAADGSILSPKVLYRLENLSGDRTVRALAAMGTRFDAALRDRLGADLAGETDEVRPIELQIVGAQLETEGRYGLADYEALGENPKLALVERYLSRVVEADRKSVV